MARIEEKIAEIADPALRQSIGEEVAKLKKHTRFGLVFEEHQPEVAPIYGKRIKRGERVAKKTGNLSEIWRVVSVKDDLAVCEQEKGGKTVAETRESFPTQQLVVIRSMGETIYPSLTPVDSVTNGDPTAPHHVLIEADNYHALQLLLFPYEGKVDCIYIDPPYNSGARDWKYNNDYIDKNDQWQHSKWLTFMAKRLRLAKRLLNPSTGVLMVTIDEKEYIHLGMLLEQLFPESKIQMVSSVINPKGTGRANELLRVNEFIFFVWNQNATIGSFEATDQNGEMIAWETMRRRNLASQRGRKGKGACGPNQFYPIYVNLKSGQIQEIGSPLPAETPISETKKLPGCVAVFPIRPDGTEMNWSLTADTCIARWKKGYVRAGKHTPDEPQKFIVQFLPAGAINAIESGDAEIISTRADGSIDARHTASKDRTPSTQWNIKSHNAEHYGTTLLKDILGKGNFPFPKSVYAVRDTIKIFAATNRDALIVDFFAGSGTTLNAVNLINSTDNGQRQCILVSNNEVSETEATSLAAQGFQPGQDEWDNHGICRSITWPRNKYTILGQRNDGTTLDGEYQTGQTVTREKPRNIRQLGFADGRNLSLSQRKQLANLVPDLPQSKLEADAPWFLDANLSVTVLWDVQQAEAWLGELADTNHVTDVYVVTTENKLFTALSKEIKETLGPIVVNEEITRSMAEGFSANLEYFRLDFLDPQEIQMGRQFSAILPILWMMAGSRGPRPDAPDAHAPWLLPDGCPFVVLMQETRFKEFVRHVESRSDLTHVFIVTNSQDTVYKLRHEWPALRVVQLYKDYLENFRINLSEKPAL
jgi:adenine-specific DNA-methyltransferase